MIGLPLKDVLRDVLAWPGNRPIDEDYEPDAFAPTTLAKVSEWLADVPRAQELIALAKTAHWSPSAAGELVGLITDWWEANSMEAGQFGKGLHSKARNQASAAARLENERTKGALSELQHRIKIAENTLGIQFDPEAKEHLKMCMDFFASKGWVKHERKNVKPAIKKLRDKGL